MPLLTAPACTPTAQCPTVPFPIALANCSCALSPGGINDLYFIPCSEALTEANITNVAWWTGLLSEGSGGSSVLGNMGIGLGSVGKKSTKTERVGSCKVEQITTVSWAIKYVLKCFDKSSEKVTHQQIDALLSKAGNYLLVARMCDGDNTVLPVGSFSVSDLDWIVPDNFEEVQSLSLELSWIEFGMPKTYDIAGLSAVIPKAA